MGTTETLDPENHVEDTDHEVEDQTNEGPEAQDFPPLFDDEGDKLSEDQLTGDETSEDEQAASPPPEGEKPEEESSDDKDEQAGPEEDAKPPQGYVPLAALHEERGKRQYLSSEVETLKAEIKDLQASSDAPVKDDFKVLSDEEFQELLEDDPTEAILYDRRLRVHEASETRKDEDQRNEQSIIDQSTRLMREAVPEIYDPGSTINQDLSDFAVKQGFSQEYLPIMTDPRTKIIPPGSIKPVLLGDAAVGQVKMLHNLYEKANGNNGRAEIEKEVTERVTKEVTDRVTKQIMAKFKATPSQEYRSLGDVPGGGDEPFDVSKNLTAAQVDKLSKSQKRAYLGG